MQQAIDIAENMLSKYTDNISGDNFQYDSGYCNALEQILVDLKDLGDGWIPVTDRLPTDLGNVLIHGPSIHFIGWFYGAENCWYNENGNINCKITHWQPLPNPPKQ